MAIKVLIVEDDSNIAQLLQLYLEKEGFETQVAADGGQGVTLFHSFAPDLVLLDIMLPVLDGWGVCRKIRETSKTPIIMMTAKGELEDKVSGLEMGADDYIVKPFEMKEVMARIHAVLRRYGGDQGGRKKLTFDKLVINMDSYELLVDGKRVDTPPKEMELLYHLAASPNRVFTRNQLLDEVWGFDYFGDSRTVDVHIKRLREKLEGVSDQWSIKTVWGVGYKFEVAGEYRETSEKQQPVPAAFRCHRQHDPVGLHHLGGGLYVSELSLHGAGEEAEPGGSGPIRQQAHQPDGGRDKPAQG